MFALFTQIFFTYLKKLNKQFLFFTKNYYRKLIFVTHFATLC